MPVRQGRLPGTRGGRDITTRNEIHIGIVYVAEARAYLPIANGSLERAKFQQHTIFMHEHTMCRQALCGLVGTNVGTKAIINNSTNTHMHGL